MDLHTTEPPLTEPVPDLLTSAGRLEQRDRQLRTATDAVVVAACALFVFAQLYPSLVLSSPVPAGGDMGAHVWGGAFLRDHLLPDLRLSGWTADWYAGFPAFQFYMVVPFLLIVALDVGVLGGFLLVVPVLAAGALGYLAARAATTTARWGLIVAAVAVAVLVSDLPYGTAFKLVTVSGVVAMPVASYAFGRLARLPFPVPAVLAVATLPFLFNRNFTIWGGNIASTLAGEFAFSISLSIALVYLGVVVRGLDTGRHRALAAALLALTGLCHLIPAFFALGATVVIALFRLRRSTLWWLGSVLPVGGLLAAFWVLPFWWQRAYVNDMGWEKIPYKVADNDYSHRLSEVLFSFGGETYWRYLIPRTGAVPDGVPIDAFADDMRWVIGLAVAGLILAVVYRLRPVAMIGLLALGAGLAFVVIPDGSRLWNARVLGFYYLCLYLLAGVAVGLAGRVLAQLWAARPEHEPVEGGAATAGAALVVAAVLLSLPLGTLPGGTHESIRSANDTYRWFGFESSTSFVRPWARWNYEGYEGKAAYPEFRDVVRTMDRVGEEIGCGRAFWEYDSDLNRYGTPMALMLLPHFTDGCIGSMEGLYFEASATTPFHFLVQSELSIAPSRAQRDLPYRDFDIDLGVAHLQMLGVRYHMASSGEAIDAAREHPDLVEVAGSGPWVVFEVQGSELVEPLANLPAVLDGVGHDQHDWICRTEDAVGRCDGPAIAWFNDPDRWDVVLASAGPDRWQRVDVDRPRPRIEPARRARVSGIDAGQGRIAFEVDRPGVPVLVKASYFPNWRASGADGPYRVAPNLMVVVPTDTSVELAFARGAVDRIAWLMTFAGIALLVLLARLPPVGAGRAAPRAPADVGRAAPQVPEGVGRAAPRDD